MKEPSSLYMGQHEDDQLTYMHIEMEETLVGNSHKSLHWSVISLSVRKGGLKGIWVTLNKEILTKR